ncbi:HNH endonuclease signature motif containing protein [Kribbella sp. VKM Ac-2568]|uniref:HNH endonuclease n=1 Tax=Kribbella sp. VKM Ac-2568 TaxID=2512219 RepID=UPI0010447724
MPDGRPAVPAELQRDVLVEAGHRCAIPTCRATPTEICHIEPWAKAKAHRFENLIALCPPVTRGLTGARSTVSRCCSTSRTSASSTVATARLNAAS